MHRFAFILHPLRVSDFTRKFPLVERLPERWVRAAFRRVPPFKLSHITGVRSPTGAETEGYFIALPLLPDEILRLPWPFVLARLVKAGHIAERLGADIVGLGAFTKIVGDRGVSVNAALSVPVTTGNSYTAASAVEGAMRGVERMGYKPDQVHAAVIGATGSIGAAVAQLVTRQVGSVVLAARGEERLQELKGRLSALGAAPVDIETDPRRAAAGADLVFTITSSSEVLLDPEDLHPGAVVCDVARPRNVSAKVLEARDDVLVMDGGVISIPGNVEFGFSFGFPPRTAEACVAETMILALEGRLEPFTLGADISVDRVEEIAGLANKHGFSVAGFRRFERAISDTEVEAVRRRAQAGRRAYAEGMGRPAAQPGTGSA